MIFIIIGLAVGLSKNEHEKSIVVKFVLILLFSNRNSFEALFTQTISGDQIRDYVEEYSSVSHIAGSEADHQQAVSTKSKSNFTINFLIFPDLKAGDLKVEFMKFLHYLRTQCLVWLK